MLVMMSSLEDTLSPLLLPRVSVSSRSMRGMADTVGSRAQLHLLANSPPNFFETFHQTFLSPFPQPFRRKFAVHGPTREALRLWPAANGVGILFSAAADSACSRRPLLNAALMSLENMTECSDCPSCPAPCTRFAAVGTGAPHGEGRRLHSGLRALRTRHRSSSSRTPRRAGWMDGRFSGSRFSESGSGRGPAGDRREPARRRTMSSRRGPAAPALPRLGRVNSKARRSAELTRRPRMAAGLSYPQLPL
jgi:hypothetical protein